MSLLKYMLMFQASSWPIETGDLLLEGEVDPIVDTNGNHTITMFGDLGITSTNPACGDSSIIFDGDGDYATIPESSDFGYGTGDFTLDTWVNFSTIAGLNWIVGAGGSNDLDLVYQTTPKILLYLESASYSFSCDTLVIGQWYHIAITRESGDLRAFIDGTQIGSTQTSTNNVLATNLFLGRQFNGQYPLFGKIDNFRSLKGTALFTTTNFNLTDRGLYYPAGTLNI